MLLVDQARLQALSAKGLDTHLVRVRVERFSEEKNKFSRLEGEFPPEVVTVKWLRKKFGPGSYLARGLNAAGMFLASGRVSIEEVPDSPKPPEPVQQVVASSGSAPNLNFTEMLLLKLIEGPRAAPVAPQDDLRETLAAMSKMIAMQMQAATMSQLRSQVTGQPNGHGSDEKLYDLLKQLVISGPGKREKGGIEEFLPLLQLGISLGARAALPGGAKENPNELPPWLSVVPEVADTLGVPLIATLAQALLPPEKAKVVLDVMSEHQQARKAEADAATVEEGEPQ